MNEFSLFVWLVLGHVVADFYLQPRAWVEHKNARHFCSGYLWAHAVIHGLISGLIVAFVGQVSLSMVIWTFVLIFSSHFIFDLIKSYSQQSLGSFIIDQVLHVLVIAVVWVIAVDAVSTLDIFFDDLDLEVFGVLLIAYLLILKPVSVLIKLVLAPLVAQIETSEEEATRTLVNGGRLIGYYERILILTLTLLSQYAAIGFILAAKSIFRFGDLKDGHSRKLTEYVLLGTLISVTFVLVIGVVAGIQLGIVAGMQASN